jgi:predicted metalloprotease with PDZ domain
MIVTYDFAELVRDLNEVVPYDWANFLRTRIDEVHPHADLAGVEQGGYRLVYKEEPNAAVSTIAANDKPPSVNSWYSIGLRVNTTDGAITDVRWSSPAAKAGLVPASKILAVDGRTFSAERLRAAIRAAKGSADPIRLVVESDSYVADVAIDYHDGERYPALERIPNTPDYLDDITKALETAGN